MSLGRILWCVLLLPNMTIAQSPEAMKYAPRPILLMDPQPNGVGVMPMAFTTDGQRHLEFIPIPQIKESMDKGGQPIRLGDVLAALVEATETINRLQAENSRLQAENDKLWKVAMKDAPQQQPPTVVVQQPVPQQPSPLERYMLLRSFLPQAPAYQPYRLPMPINPNANRLQTNCTTQTNGPPAARTAIKRQLAQVQILGPGRARTLMVWAVVTDLPVGMAEEASGRTHLDLPEHYPRSVL